MSEIERAIMELKVWRMCPVRFGGLCPMDEDDECWGFCWRSKDVSAACDVVIEAIQEKQQREDAGALTNPNNYEFDVVDNRTGQYPDCEYIALHEDWAGGLIYCDVDSFALTEDGGLVLIDDCGNVAFCPSNRFMITLRTKPQSGEGG